MNQLNENKIEVALIKSIDEANMGQITLRADCDDDQSIKVESVKNLLASKYKGLSFSWVELLEKEVDNPCLESEIRDALRKMEAAGQLYIERHPPFTEDANRPRRSIKEKDILYFNTFPTITRKSLLYKTKVEYGNFCINHVFGCAHGCNYPCYAKMLANRYGRIRSDEQWLHPRLVGNALELLDKEILKYKDQIDCVHLSFMTDPFMYDAANNRVHPQVKNLTLEIIQKLNKHGIRATVLTKGMLAEELSDRAVYGSDNWYGITLVSLDPSFQNRYEPFAAPTADRIGSLKLLHEKGLKTWVSVEPYPTPNIVKQDLTALLDEMSFVDAVIFGKMNYNKLATGYTGVVEFYKMCVREVRTFCEERNIKCYIKKGTPGNIPNESQMFRL